MRAVKTLEFEYATSSELAGLMEDFPLMCNDAIRIALEANPKSRFALQALAYQRLKNYRLFAHYIHSACEAAYSVYRNKNRKKDPYIKRPFLKLEAGCYRLDHLLLRLPIRARDYVFLVLRPSAYHLAIIDNPSLKRGSVTLTARTVSVAFSKEIAETEPRGQIGTDVNERNITWSDSKGNIEQKDTSGVAEIKERYRGIRADIARKTRGDRRVAKKLLAKYGKRERNRTVQALHELSKEVVDGAKRNQFGIVMENLVGIRKLYRRGNSQGTPYRGRMNVWTFRGFQRQVQYKAAWSCVNVKINPRGTSRNCPNCGSHVVPLAGRKLFCHGCDRTWDRDILASMNTMAAAQGPAARPPTYEAMMERLSDAVDNALSRKVENGLLDRQAEPVRPKAFYPHAPGGH